MANKDLRHARDSKYDEFYTRLSYIENELSHYTQHFKGKIVLANADDPRTSAFVKYFVLKFKTLGLKELIATCYRNQNIDLFTQNLSDRSVYISVTEKTIDELTAKNNGVLNVKALRYLQAQELQGDGDFRSPECVEFMRRADITCTNPPFSLLREYVAQLENLGKNYLFIANQNAITYKEIFPLIKNQQLWLGYSGIGDMVFDVPEDSPPRPTRFGIDEKGNKWRSLGNVCWFTNLDHDKRHRPLTLYKKYNPREYPKYDNYDAIEVSRVDEIPEDYPGIMGVPVTLMGKFCPDQFEIIGLDRYTVPRQALVGGRVAINGKPRYARILIKNKHPRI